MIRILPRFILFFTVLLTGCIKEDLSKCPTGIKVYFTYLTTYAGSKIDPVEVNRMNLYLFDSEGILRTVVCDENPNISPEYYLTVNNLPAGEYRFVAWGNLRGCFSAYPADFSIGETTFEQALLLFDHTEVASLIEEPLFFAYLSAEQVTTAREQRFYMPIAEQTNTIRLTTEGLPLNDDSYCFTVTDNNGRYKFDNSYALDNYFTYPAPCDKDEQGQPATSLNVLKLAAGRQVKIELYNETAAISCYTANLIELLDARGVDYALQNDFDIHLIFRTDMKVDVSIDNWLITEEGLILN